MANVDSILEFIFAEYLALSARDIEESAKSRKWLLDRIANEIEADISGSQLYGPEKFVNFGSYFKGTKVKDVDEYDVLVVVDSCNGHFSEDGIITGYGKGSCSPNHKYDQQYYKVDGSGVSPAKILKWLQRTAAKVLDPLGGETPLRNGQAITVKLKSSDISIDLVPAGIFGKATNDTEIFYNIPKGDSGDGWIITNPKIDKDYIKYAAADRPGFKNIIRLIKFVRDTHRRRIPSFAIECEVLRYAWSNTWGSSTTSNLLGALKWLQERLESGFIPDLLDAEKNLIQDKDDADFFAIHLQYLRHIIEMQKYEQDENKALEEILSEILYEREEKKQKAVNGALLRLNPLSSQDVRKAG